MSHVLDSHDGTPYPEEWADRRAELLAIAQSIEDAWGSPLHYVSGYRPPAYNAKIGGAKQSQHMFGRAIDFQPEGDPARSPELHAFILAMQKRGELPTLGGLGAYPKWVHIDTRPHTRLVRWGEVGMPKLVRGALSLVTGKGLEEADDESDSDEWVGYAVLAGLACAAGGIYLWTRK
jgi:hypothetical protein